MIRILIILLFASLTATAQIGGFMAVHSLAEVQPVYQQITDRALSVSSANGSQKVAVKVMARSLYNAGIYNEIHFLHLHELYNGSYTVNLVNPLDFDGSLRATTNGTYDGTAGGIILNGSSQTANTNFINDLASEAPYLGVFYITDIAVESSIFTSGSSPFSMEPRFNNKAFFNSWAGHDGVAVPATPDGFNGAMRPDGSTVAVWQNATKYSNGSEVSSPNPMGGPLKFQGNATAPFVLKVGVGVNTISDSQVGQLKTILETTLSNL